MYIGGCICGIFCPNSVGPMTAPSGASGRSGLTASPLFGYDQEGPSWSYGGLRATCLVNQEDMDPVVIRTLVGQPMRSLLGRLLRPTLA